MHNGTCLMRTRLLQMPANHPEDFAQIPEDGKVW